MQLCDGGRNRHEEVCYAGDYCPVCDKQDEIKRLEDELGDANQENDDLEAELKEVRAELEQKGGGDGK